MFVCIWIYLSKSSLGRVSTDREAESPSGTNVSRLFFLFCLDLLQRLRLSGRMSALCTRPSPRTLDVISSTWSLHYLLSCTMLPSHRTATWNAWLASSLKPSWNCALKRCRLFLRSSASSHVCRSQKKIPALLLSGRENKQGHPLAVFSRPAALPPVRWLCPTVKHSHRSPINPWNEQHFIAIWSFVHVHCLFLQG